MKVQKVVFLFILCAKVGLEEINECFREIHLNQVLPLLGGSRVLRRSEPMTQDDSVEVCGCSHSPSAQGAL